MSYRYYEVSALGVDREDKRYDKLGAGYSYTSLIRARTVAEAETLFRKDKRFRRTAHQNGEYWRDVPVVVSECPERQFARDIPRPVRPSYRRKAFLKRISA